MTPVLDVLFEPDDDPVRELRSALPALPAVCGATDLKGHAAAALREMLAVPVGTLALLAWATHADVQAAREATARQPGRRQVVALAEHTLRAEHHPVVELEVGTGAAARRLLTLTLEVTVEVGAVHLVVLSGRIGRVLPLAASSAAARLTAGPICLAHGTLDVVDLRIPAQLP